MACDCALCSRFELGPMEIQGGQATVLRERDLLSETYVAIKLIPTAGLLGFTDLEFAKRATEYSYRSARSKSNPRKKN